MTPTQKIQLRMSELRQKINDMPEIRVDDADKLAERQKLVDKVQALEVEYRAAIKAEDDTTLRRGSGPTLAAASTWARCSETSRSIAPPPARSRRSRRSAAWARTTYPLRC